MSEENKNNFEEFKNLYEVTKTVRFELKSVHFREENHVDNINFEKTKEWIDKEYFKEIEDIKTKDERNETLKDKLKVQFFDFENIKKNFDYLLQQLVNNNIPPFCIFIKASLFEYLDSNEFHNQKKKNRFNQTKFIPLSHLKIRNSYNWFLSGMEQKLFEIEKFKVFIKDHQLWGQDDFQERQNNSRWYADVESFCKRFEQFLNILKYIEVPLKNELAEHGELNIEQKKILKKIEENFFSSEILKEEKNIRVQKEIRYIIEFIKENKFIECGLSSLNEKSLNKNFKKIEMTERWLEDTKKKQEETLKEIHELDYDRKIVLDGDKNRKKGLYELLNEKSKKLVKDGTDKCPNFAIHLLQTPKYNQEIQNLITRKKKLQEIDFEKRAEQDKEDLRNIKKEIYKLKIEKGIIQDRKKLFLDKGILSFKYKFRNNIYDIEELLGRVMKEKDFVKRGELLNFQNIWENRYEFSKNGDEILFLKIENIKKNNLIDIDDSEFVKLYRKNNELIEKKRNLSQKYGNNKNLINSLQREIERQGKIKFQSIILRDKDFYYLAFLERENRKELKNEYFFLAESSDYEFLEYERLTFKALEKLVLIENATFKVFDELEDEKLAIELRLVYEKIYKEKQFNDYKLSREEKEYIKKEKIKKSDFAKKEQEKVKNNVIQILIKVIEKLGYIFSSKEYYKTLDEFASDINLQCYKVAWKKIDWNKIIEGEELGKIKLFKIHNKDFSRIKRKYQLSEDKSKHRKNNLFTEYWLDLFEKNNKNIRLLPEIDLFKRRKEFEEKDRKFIKTAKRSGEKELKNAIEKNRYYEDKFYASFRLQFYPEKISPTVEEFNDDIETKTKEVKKYFLGLDRGENELLTYCLIDDQNKIVIDKETREPIVGDWNKDDNDYDYAKRFKNFIETKNSLLNKYKERRFYEENSQEYKKIQKEIDELGERNNIENILQAKQVKEGFCGHVLEKINNIMLEYKNVYIVMEDLDIEQNQEDEGNSNKEKNLEKLLGGTAYQIIENVIISKFKYYQTKDNELNGSQTVPNIERIRDLRIVEDKQKIERNKYGRIKFLKSKEQIGNLLFVDDFLTSQMCPECGFCICSKEEKKRAEKFGKPITYEEVEISNIQVLEKNGIKIVSLNGKEYELKHFGNISKEGTKNKILNGDIESIKNIFKNRLKAQRIKWNKEQLGADPFFCSACGKNTNEKNFIEPLKSGDDIAAYNIAKRGLEFIKK